MKRSISLAVSLLAMLPSAALGASSPGPVHSVNPVGHALEVVAPGHRFIARLGAGGSVTFRAKVLRVSAPGVLVELRDGRRLVLGSNAIRLLAPASSRSFRRLARAAAPAALPLDPRSLRPGMTVLVHENAAADGGTSCTFTLPGAPVTVGALRSTVPVIGSGGNAAGPR